jgi:hypothetical protein
VQHPKPLPTPDTHGVFKFASDVKTTQTAVEAERCSKTLKKESAVKNVEEEKK